MVEIFSTLPSLIINTFIDKHEVSSQIAVTCYRHSTLELATFLKLSSLFAYNNVIDAFVVDSLENEFRYTVVYLLQSTIFNTGVRVYIKTKDGLALFSWQGIYPGFNWVEREMWDLSGIFFIKHPDLRRILTDYGFSGHPLRKDFPISGFKEAHYADSIKQIRYANVELAQSFRLAHISPIWFDAQTF